MKRRLDVFGHLWKKSGQMWTNNPIPRVIHWLSASTFNKLKNRKCYCVTVVPKYLLVCIIVPGMVEELAVTCSLVIDVNFEASFFFFFFIIKIRRYGTCTRVLFYFYYLQGSTSRSTCYRGTCRLYLYVCHVYLLCIHVYMYVVHVLCMYVCAHTFMYCT